MSAALLFHQLPQPIQFRIRSFLAANNFVKAKELYDHCQKQAHPSRLLVK